MASQRVTMIKIGGQVVQIVTRQLRNWHDEVSGNDGQADDVRQSVDRFAEALRANAHHPPIAYFVEWIDLWSMGDLLPGLGNPHAAVLAGKRFEICCHELPVEFNPPTIGGEPPQESLWLKQRLAEAEGAWSTLVSEAVLIVLREPLGGLIMDEEIVASLSASPAWLTDTLYTRQEER